jgi:hypothetical protein
MADGPPRGSTLVTLPTWAPCERTGAPGRSGRSALTPTTTAAGGRGCRAPGQRTPGPGSSPCSDRSPARRRGRPGRQGSPRRGRRGNGRERGGSARPRGPRPGGDRPVVPRSTPSSTRDPPGFTRSPRGRPPRARHPTTETYGPSRSAIASADRACSRRNPSPERARGTWRSAGSCRSGEQERAPPRLGDAVHRGGDEVVQPPLGIRARTSVRPHPWRSTNAAPARAPRAARRTLLRPRLRG